VADAEEGKSDGGRLPETQAENKGLMGEKLDKRHFGRTLTAEGQRRSQVKLKLEKEKGWRGTGSFSGRNRKA